MQDPGELLPLTCELSAFDAFGVDVSQYMHFTHAWTRIFMICFLLNFSNIILNIEGGSLGELSTALTAHTLGNVGSGASPYRVLSPSPVTLTRHPHPSPVTLTHSYSPITYSRNHFRM